LSKISLWNIQRLDMVYRSQDNISTTSKEFTSFVLGEN
jgi:hypothetical protein